MWKKRCSLVLNRANRCRFYPPWNDSKTSLIMQVASHCSNVIYYMYHIANNAALREYARECIATCALLTILLVYIHIYTQTHTIIKYEDRRCGKERYTMF